MTDYALTISDTEIRRYQLMAEMAQVVEGDLWQLAGILPGATVVDVGCGPAAVSVVLARAVGPSGRVVGVERDEASLAAARQIVADSGLRNVELRSGTEFERMDDATMRPTIFAPQFVAFGRKRG